MVKPAFPCGFGRSLQFGSRSREYADLVGRIPLHFASFQPFRDDGTLLIGRAEDPDDGLGAVEHGDGSAAPIGVAVHIRGFARQESVRLPADLMGGSVVDLQGL